MIDVALVWMFALKFWEIVDDPQPLPTLIH